MKRVESMPQISVIELNLG